MKAKLVVAMAIFMMVATLAGCGDNLDLSDPVIYIGTLVSVVYSNNQAEGYQLTFLDGKTIFVYVYINPSHSLYGKGFDLGESYTISLTRSGYPYAQRTDVLEQKREH